MKRLFGKLGIAASLCLALAGCGESGPYTLTQTEQATTENGAREYAERAGGKYLSCTGQDTDRVGYVTCGFKDAATGAVEELRCSYRNGAKGCKRK